MIESLVISHRAVRWWRGRVQACSLFFALVGVLGGCASNSPRSTSASVDTNASSDLACTLLTNCVSSTGRGAMPALHYDGPPQAALVALNVTLARYPEATIVRREGLALTAVFTTPLGFRDEVDFLVDPASGRIDFRSRSTLGLFDFAKNRTRMAEFSARFARLTRR